MHKHALWLALSSAASMVGCGPTEASPGGGSSEDTSDGTAASDGAATTSPSTTTAPATDSGVTDSGVDGSTTATDESTGDDTGSGDSGSSSGGPPLYTVGGTVTSLSGAGLVLQNAGGDDLEVDASGAFVFSTGLPEGDSYDVTVLTQPGASNDFCTISAGSGTMGSQDITDVTIDCFGPEDLGTTPDLWLRADSIDATDGSAVPSWPDRSGSGLDATQAIDTQRPLLHDGGPGGLPYLEFDGTDDFLDGDADPLASDTYYIFLLAEIPDQTSDYLAIYAICPDTGRDWDVGMAYTVSPADGVAHVESGGAGVGLSVPLASGWQINTLAYGGGTAEAFVNGASVGTDPYTDTTLATEHYMLGARSPDDGAGVAFYAPNRYAEVLVYTSALTEAEREQVECYLVRKYDLSATASNATCPS